MTDASIFQHAKIQAFLRGVWMSIATLAGGEASRRTRYALRVATPGVERVSRRRAVLHDGRRAQRRVLSLSRPKTISQTILFALFPGFLQ